MTRFLLRMGLGGALMFALVMSVSLMMGRGIHSVQLTFMTSNRVPQMYDVRMNQAMPLHITDTFDFLLAWSPDGRYLAYITHQDNLRPMDQIVRLYDSDTHTTQDVPNVTDDGVSATTPTLPVTITWLADSTRLAYFNHSGLAYVYHIGDGTQTPIGEKVTQIVASPTDERIATIHRVDGRYWLMVANTDGTDRRRLLNMAEGNTPYWSPDSRYLILLSGTNLLGEARLTLVESWHGVIREYGGFVDRAYAIQWALDGRSVSFTDTGDNNFYTLDIDSGAITLLETPQTEYLTPPVTSTDGVWQVSSPIKLNGVTLAERRLYLSKAGAEDWQPIAQTNHFVSFLWRP